MDLNQLKTLDIKDLKVMAYDQLSQIEGMQRGLNAINNEIGIRTIKNPLPLEATTETITPEVIPQP